MNDFQAFALSVISSPEYRETIRTRALAGNLPPDVELFLLEMADGRTPMSADHLVREPLRQGPTLALIRPAARRKEVQP